MSRLTRANDSSYFSQKRRQTARAAMFRPLLEPLESRRLLAISDFISVTGNSDSAEPAISSDGRYVAFWSSASNLVVGDTNGSGDVFVKDMHTGMISRISTTSVGAQTIGGGSASPSISADGRFVAFASTANNLVPGDTNGVVDIFVKDTQTGTISRVNTDSAGAEGNHLVQYYQPAISADGRYVAFASDATNLVPGDTNGHADVFVKDVQTGILTRVSTNDAGAQAVGSSDYVEIAISANGRYVAFESDARNLVAGDSNGRDFFLKDTQTGLITRVNTDSAGVQANQSDPYITTIGISADGRHVAFVSTATNLVPGDTNDAPDVFVKDTLTGVLTRVSTDAAGGQADRGSDRYGRGGAFATVMSGDGRFVLFASNSTNLIAGDPGRGLFLKDMQTGTVARISEINPISTPSDAGAISGDGRFVAFHSGVNNLVAGDLNGAYDVFVKDMQTGQVKLVSQALPIAELCLVGGASLIDDPNNAGGKALLVCGTSNSDAISVQPATTAGNIIAYVNPFLPPKTFAAASIVRIIVLGGAGSDAISVDQRLRLPSVLFGEAGNDAISGGAGSDSLDGGAGNDSLAGNAGDDTLCGGVGTDYLVGGVGMDTLAEMGAGTFVLTASQLKVGAESNPHGGLERAVLTGDGGANTFDLSGWNGTGAVDGGGGIDKLIATGNANFILTDAALTRSVGGAITLARIEDAELTAGSGNNVLDGTGFTGRLKLAGGDGNDILKSGTGPAILLGGAGNDELRAGAGRSVQIGGAGADRLFGGTDDDLLIEGTTSYDANSLALLAILNEWNSLTAYATRVAHLRGTSGGLNGSYRLTSTTVLKDTSIDSLTGNGGMEWYFAKLTNPAKDTLTDQALSEIVN